MCLLEYFDEFCLVIVIRIVAVLHLRPTYAVDAYVECSVSAGAVE